MGQNFLFLGYAHVGWVTDLVSGAAFRPHREIEVTFDSHLLENSDSPSVRQRIAIAPPQTDHPMLSDRLGEFLQKYADEKGSLGRVVPFSTSANLFADYGLDYDDDDLNLDDLTEIYWRLGVRKIIFSRLVNADGQPRLRIMTRDIFAPHTDQDQEVALPVEQIEQVKTYTGLGRRATMAYWLPNSLFWDLGESATSLSIDKNPYQAKPEVADDFVGTLSSYISALSIRRVVRPSQRSQWRYRFRMVPSASFSYAKEKFKTAPTPISDTTFMRTHFDLGWGPSFNYENNKWNFYLNTIPLLAYNAIEAQTPTAKYRKSETGVSVGLELGIYYFFGKNWLARFYSRSATVPSELWTDVLTDVTGSRPDVSAANFVSTGLAIGYLFPNKDLPY